MAPFFSIPNERDDELSRSTPAPLNGPVAAPISWGGGAASLLDPRFEHDSCGVGFVATTTGEATHDILEKAITALARLAHRGAVASDGLSSDGVGSDDGDSARAAVAGRRLWFG